MNFTFGSKLADMQEAIIDAYKNNEQLTLEQFDYLNSFNVYTSLAYVFAPSNLVIRDICIKDKFHRKVSSHRIFKMMEKLTERVNKYLIWKESYSYWQYTKKALELFDIYKETADRIDKGFWITSYDKGAVAFPMMHGDCRHVPLDNTYDIPRVNIFRSDNKLYSRNAKDSYEFKKDLVGLNMHIQHCDEVIDNVYAYNNWYEGYDKKYKNGFEELKDMIKSVLGLKKCGGNK